MLFALNPLTLERKAVSIHRASSDQFWPSYSQKFRFGAFGRGATWWVKFEHFDQERVFRFRIFHHCCIKFLSRIFIRFGRHTAKNSNSVLSTRCDHFPISVFSTNSATNGGFKKFCSIHSRNFFWNFNKFFQKFSQKFSQDLDKTLLENCSNFRCNLPTISRKFSHFSRISTNFH